MSTPVIVAAAGRGERFGADKLWIDVAGKPLLAWTLQAIGAAGLFNPVIVVTAEDHWPAVEEIGTALGLTIDLVAGGDSRQASVWAGLGRCGKAEVVCVHDAARPLCPPRVFAAVIAAAAAAGAATAGLPCADTIKRVDGRRVVETLNRADLVSVQTPQAFLTDALRQAHERAYAEGVVADDDCALIERAGGRVLVVDGDPRAFKVTVPEDLILLEALLAADRV